ncbi:MAG: sulfotransferase domain-containing protein [Deltaproteobacteria bacterium]|nr:sulfotransferase domain-containing protein [Deltaproteobacteria bacterium]
MSIKTAVQYQYLVIGGTFKAATSSVFTYLSAHPGVCGSSVKETAFFIRGYTGDHATDIKNYLNYFKAPKPDAKVLMEASPGYLGGGGEIARRIKATLPEAKLIFILRDPINRLNSYYNFHIGLLTKDFDRDTSLEEYIERCKSYSEGVAPGALKMDERHLRALEIGRYADYLEEYYRVFPRKDIKVVFHENLNAKPFDFMVKLSGFIGIDPAFYDGYRFEKANVTFSSKVELLHRIANYANKRLEKALRQRPRIKSKITKAYKLINQRKEGYSSIPESVTAKLTEYYGPSNKKLASLLKGEDLPQWVK